MIIITISVLTLVAAMVGTLSGFGTSTILIPVLVQFFPPMQAIFLVAIIHWFGNIWKLLLFRTGLNLRLLFLFGIIGILTSYIGASISIESNKTLFLQILGFFLLIYAIFLIFRSGFRVPSVNSAAIAGGSLSGFFAGLFGIGGAIRGMFLMAFNLPKAVYIATAGAIGLVIDSTRIITYFTGGATLPKHLWWGLLLFIPVSFLGAWIAKKIVNWIPQQKFRSVIAVFLFLVGVKLMIWP